MTENDDLKSRLITRAKDLGAKWATFISPKDIITAEWTRLKCLYGCFNYGRLSCPPHSPDAIKMRRVLDSYQRGLIFEFMGKWEPEGEEGQGDEKTLATRALWHEEGDRRKFNKALITLERELFLEGFYKALGIGSGPCLICGLKCNSEGHCIHPNEARPSMEACGIDVYATVQKFGREIQVASTPKSCYSLFGLILID